MSEGSEEHVKEWELEPETEYRFELDPGTTLAIKVNTLCSDTLGLADLYSEGYKWPCRSLWHRIERRYNIPLRPRM